jgi:glycosyltransferase involved in cell wall biosynthesis
MKLSIVIPAYNEENYIGQCLGSIAAEQARTNFDVEIIVVNNASVDRTGEVARSFSFVRVVDEPRKGLVRARQTGYESSTGDLVANVDADTLMPEGWIKRVFREFEVDSHLVALSGPYIYYDLSFITNWSVLFWYRMGKIIGFFNTLFTRRSETMLQGGNFVLRRSALEQAGGFDLNFDFYGEDTAIARKMSSQGKVKFTFHLPMYTSGRRLRVEGVLTMAWKYGINFFWTIFFNKAYTKEQKDIRL